MPRKKANRKDHKADTKKSGSPHTTRSDSEPKSDRPDLTDTSVLTGTMLEDDVSTDLIAPPTDQSGHGSQDGSAVDGDAPDGRYFPFKRDGDPLPPAIEYVERGTHHNLTPEQCESQAEDVLMAIGLHLTHNIRMIPSQTVRSQLLHHLACQVWFATKQMQPVEDLFRIFYCNSPDDVPVISGVHSVLRRLMSEAL